MSFFEPPPPPPPPPPAQPTPEWLGPAENVLPGAFPLEVVVARTDKVALYAFGGRGYPNGWEFTFGLRTRELRDGRTRDPFMAWHRGELTDDVLRIGLALADGRKATVFDRPRFPFDEDAAPPDAVLLQRGGGGGSFAWEFKLWAWPLPPAGALDLVVEWPEEGIPLTRAALDSAAIRAAAERAQELWPPAPPPTGAWARYA